MPKKSLSIVSLTGLLFMTLAPFAAHGADITWSGASSTNFNTAGNWVGGFAPGSSDVAMFGTSVTANQPSVVANQNIGGLKFLSSSGGWTMSGANQLTIDASAAGFIDDSYNTGGTDTISNSILFTGANGNALINAGGGGGGNLNIEGTVTADRSLSLRIASGTLTVSNLVVNSTYTLTKDGPGTLVINGLNPTANTGSFTLSGGTLIVGNDGALGKGGFTFNTRGTLQANKDVTITNTVTGPQGLGLFATVSGSNNITFTGNWNGAGSDMFLFNGLSSGKTLSLGNVVIASGANAKTFSILGTGDTVINGVISNGSTVGSSMLFGSTGTTTLKGASTYTGGTKIAAGKLTLNGATGSLVSTSTLTFDGTGIFNYDNVGAGGATSQALGSLTNTSGDATIQTTRTEAQDVALTFTNMTPRAAGGGTRNFGYAGTVGTIGTDSKISFTTWTNATSALIDSATFFGGSNYAAYDSAGFVRAMNYTTDNGGAGIAVSGTNTTFTAAGAANKQVDLGTTGVITAAGTETINTLRIGGSNTVTLGSGSTLSITNGGILKTGGNASTISGGAGAVLKAGAINDLVVRTDAAGDSLTIDTVIGNESGWVTKTGAGTLTLNGAVALSGGLNIQNGTVVLANNVGYNSGGGVGVYGGSTLTIGANNVSVVGSVSLNSGTITGTTGVLTATQGYNLVSGTVSAILAGPGGMNVNNRGFTAVLSRSNTYAGATTISNGALNIQNASALGSSAAGTTVTNSGQLQLQGGINVASEALALASTGPGTDGGLLNLSGNNTWGGLVTLGAASRINSDAGTLTLSGGINAANQAITFGGYGNTVVSEAITNSTSTLTKDGYGKLTLSGANNYTGLTTNASGVLNIQNATALGATNTGTALAAGATLQLQGGITVTGEELSLRGLGYNIGGALQNVSGDNTWTGTITNAAASRINSDAGTLTLSNGINGANNALTFGGAGNIVVGAITNSTGALTKDGTGILTLNGANTYSGTTLLMGGTLKISAATAYASTTTISNGTLLLANQNALQNGTVATTTNSGAAIAFDSSVSGKAFTIGGLSGSGGIALLNNAAVPEAITLTVGNNNANTTYSGVMTNTGTFIKAGTGTLTMNGSTVAMSTGSYQVSGGQMTAQANAAFNSRSRVQVDSGAMFQITAGGIGLAGVEGAGTIDLANGSDRNVRLSGTGSYTFRGMLTNSGVGKMTIIADLKEGGTQVLAGTSAYTGGTTMRSGTLALDYDAITNSAKLNPTGVLTLNGGTIELRGGSGTETVASTTFGGLPGGGAGAQANITRSSGSKVLALNAITFGSSGALNIASNNIATTTSANTNGLLGGGARITVGGADWAANDGSGNIVAYSGYTTYTNNNAGVNTNNYLVTGSASSTVGVAMQTLKITTTGAGQSLNLGTQTLTIGNGSGQSAGILFVGSDNYTITAGAVGASGGGNYQAIQNYGTGKLTLAAGLSHQMSFFGTGYTVLGANSSANAGINVGSGTVEFSSNAQIGSPTGSGVVNIYGGRLVANTAGGNISLTNGAGGLSYRTVTLGSDNACLDVIGGGILTVAGVISSADANGDTPLTLGSTNSSGKIVLGGANTYTGTTRLEGGIVSVSQNANLGNTNNWIDFSGNGTLETTASFGSTRVVNVRSGKTGTFAPAVGTALTLSNGIQGPGAIAVDGSGTLELLSSANSYTGKTTIKSGILKLGAGASIASSSEVNLGTTNSPGTLDLTANSSYGFGSGQTVSGVGTISIGASKTVTVAGILAPGNSTGKIIVGGNLSLTSTSEIKMELAGTGGVAGTDFDQIDVSGYTLTADGILTITGYSGYDVTQTASYDLFDFSYFSNNFTSVTVGGFGLTYDNVNAWKGTNGPTTYSLGINNGILAVETVPEPSTIALLGLAGAGMLAWRLRKSRRA